MNKLLIDTLFGVSLGISIGAILVTGVGVSTNTVIILGFISAVWFDTKVPEGDTNDS